MTPHPYRESAEREAPPPTPDLPEPVSDRSVAIVLLVVGATGVAIGVSSEAHAIEMALGALFVWLSLWITFADLRVRSRRRNSDSRAGASSFTLPPR